MVFLNLDLQFRQDLELDLRFGVLDAFYYVVVETTELVLVLLELAFLAVAPLALVHAFEEGQETVVCQVLERVCKVMVQFPLGHIFVEV